MNNFSGHWNTGNLMEPVSGRYWDKAEIREQVTQRGHACLAAGITSNDRVLIHFGNRLEFFAELLAIWQVGACAIPVDPRLTAYEVEKLATAADARFNVINDDTPRASLAVIAGSHVRHTLEKFDQSAGSSSSRISSVGHRLDDDALILFTSGSTGNPKGVVHTHRSLLARWSSLQQSLGLDHYQRTLCVLPTHFGHGLICNCLFPWLSGCDLFIAPAFESDLIMRLGSLIDEYRISFISSVPSIWNLALKVAAPPQKRSLERVHVGSAPLSENNWRQIQNWAGTQEVLNAYGITETGSWVAGTTGGPVVPESGLIGEPWGATIRVVNDNRICAAGETGMVWLQTPGLMKGYFQRQDLTDTAVQQGWFMTGDIGLLDDRGRLFLRGRERDEINKGGTKIYPADIDEVVERFAAVTDVCCFGFEDKFYGENVGLAVVLDNPSEAALSDLYQWLQFHLAEHKHPVQWFVLEEIPRTSRGKINRATVKEVCESMTPLKLQDIQKNDPRHKNL